MTRILPPLNGHEARGYASHADRVRAIEQLRRRGFNHFVCYHDVSSPYALTIATAAWVPRGSVHVNW